MRRHDRPYVCYSKPFKDGEQLLAECRQRGLENIVSKRKHSPYKSGKCEWMKVKCTQCRKTINIAVIFSSGELQHAAVPCVHTSMSYPAKWSAAHVKRLSIPCGQWIAAFCRATRYRLVGSVSIAEATGLVPPSKMRKRALST